MEKELLHSFMLEVDGEITDPAKIDKQLKEELENRNLQDKMDGLDVYVMANGHVLVFEKEPTDG